LVGDAKYNLISQDPQSMSHKTGGLSVNGDVAVGQRLTLIGRCVSAAALKAVVTYTVDFFAKDAPFKFRILDIRVKLVSYTQADWTDADGGNLDVTVQDGDGAASETFTDVLADQAFDDTYTDGMVLDYPSATIVLADNEIAAGESLRAQMICDPDDTVVAAAGADACTMEFVIDIIRVS
jgi:hypothetical protein